MLFRSFHAIFHSFWHSFQSNFHFFMAATSFSLGFCLIPPWPISCNISYLLACISLKFSFLHGSYFILPSDFVSFLSGSYFKQYFIPSGIHFNQIFISSWHLLHSPSDFVSFSPGSSFMQISFLLAFISIKFSFHMAATSFSLGFCLIPL